jgi:site-specific DNA-cytosine methylase
MSSHVYYNERDPYLCEWLRNLIKQGQIPNGVVDERSIEVVRADEVAGFRQCHFFGGIGGWPFALKLAGCEELECWTGSAPCQPFAVGGKRRGANDARHLFPVWLDLIRERRPPIVFGEQVEGPLGRQWLARVRDALAELGYAVGGAALPACSVGAPHRRDRLYFGAVADPDSGRWRGGHVMKDCTITGRASDGRKINVSLAGVARLIAAHGTARTGSMDRMASSAGLAPAFACWLMGLPLEVDACAPTETPSSRKSAQLSSRRSSTLFQVGQP